MKAIKRTFVHLSDIHFLNAKYDLDEHLRSGLLVDAIAMQSQLPEISGILVSGDVAFSGREDEYKNAQKWLQELCDRVKCDPECVWTIPGNHDIDRSKHGVAVTDMHKALRSCADSDLDREIKNRLTDETAADLLFQPLHAYNNFAAQFQCRVDASRPYWEDKSIELNDGTKLVIRGMNSTLVSNKSDHKDNARLLVGTYQSQLPHVDGTVYLTMCHHPPDWLRDGEDLEQSLVACANVLLFGHKHKHVLRRLDDALKISAGAVHPERDQEPWDPRYNYVSIWMGEGNPAQLNVEVHPRVWKGSHTFCADADEHGKLIRHYELPIRSWQKAKTTSASTSSTASTASGPVTSSAPTSPQPEGSNMNPNRAIIYRFYRLPQITRIEVLKSVGLFEAGDASLADEALFEKAFKRAKELNLLGKLWDELAKRYPSEQLPNPFLATKSD